MTISRRFLVVSVFLLVSAANAQVSNTPKNVQDRLAEVGPVWNQLAGDMVARYLNTLEVYTPLLLEATDAGIQVSRDIAYGSHPLQKLDVYSTEDISDAPIVVFIHGGGFTRGARDTTPEVHANITRFFARHGMIGVNADYRLAPEAPWPAGPEDVSAIVKWVKTNGARYGGDINHIYLIGHSAGAMHVAGYTFDESLQPIEGAGIAGSVLISGRYDVRVSDEMAKEIAKPVLPPGLKSAVAYFGRDTTLYAERSPISFIQDGPRIPVFIVTTEYENFGLDVSGAQLFAALCNRDGACPRFTRLQHHNHLSVVFHFNTADELLGRQIIDFIDRGR